LDLLSELDESLLLDELSLLLLESPLFEELSLESPLELWSLDPAVAEERLRLSVE
jgi:hypothetical protein